MLRSFSIWLQSLSSAALGDTIAGHNLNLYAVDRLGKLAEGQVCELVKHADVHPPEIAAHVEGLFPDGVSAHGERYLLRKEAQTLIASPMLELVFEQVRRSAYAERPSRFQCMFAVEALDDARQFQTSHGGVAIYKVTAEVVFRGNMNLLHAGNSILVTSWLAHQYWEGLAGPGHPFWEWLLKCPVSVGERVA